MTESIESFSLGQQLKNAREKLNLTLEEVAQKTNLKKNHIESLENDIFILPNVPPVFVRGYVRNYVRFLRLPENLVQQANYGEVTIPKEVKKAAPIPVSNNHKSQSRWVKWLTSFILLCAVGMTLAWWWQEHKKDELSRHSLVVEANNEIASQSTRTETPDSLPNQPSAEIIGEPAVADVLATVKTEETEIQERNASTSAIQAHGQAVENSAENANEISTETTAAVILSDAQPQPATSPDTSMAVAHNDELRIEISGGQSWITVRNSKSKKSLAEKLYNAGDVLTFNDNEQYRLTIGAPAYVKIYYKGELVPLKVDGRVARIKLPQ